MLTEYKKTFHRKKITITFLVCGFVLLLLFFRLIYLMVGKSAYYQQKAVELHERERSIKAARGKIIDCNGTVLADNKRVCTISVIHNQIEDKEEVIRILCEELGLSEEYVRKRVEKYSSIERIKSNVDKETGDKIRNYDLAGVKIDEDFKRFYPYGELGSKVLGFTGGDNQGIIGLEVVYEEYLKGTDGTILTVTDAKGIEIEDKGERRIEPVAGNDLQISMDLNIQSYATQLAYQAMENKEADSVCMMVMKVKTGEILAMVNVPEFDLNNPFELTDYMLEDMEEKTQETATVASLTDKEKQDLLNKMWRNACINDTYEPGSTFKIITAAAGLESGVVTKDSQFSCPGFIIVEDRKIRCHKTTGHGSEDFVHATMNSCNPVFITVGLRMGRDTFYHYFEQFGLLKKTGIDLPGEAATIMHKKENMKAVELATVSFGQSFQITPIELMVTAASIINDGKRVTPHFGVRVLNKDKEAIETFTYPVRSGIVSSQTSVIMREILEKVVSEGGGGKAYIEGVRIGGKTATSQTLPRNSGKYIASFIGFAPADDPEIIAMVIIKHPKGTYYGGQIAAPVIKTLFENILPYLGIMDYNINDMS